jgi:hypothetical protein
VKPAYLATGVAAVLVALALVHVYWAAGGRAWAADAVPTRGGAPLFRPGPVATLAVAAMLALAAALVLGRAGGVRRVAPAALYQWGTWALGSALALRAVGDFRYVGLFKRERGTRFAALDTRLYTPLAAALAAATLYLAAA